jgi:transcriptional regulator with XRE-family HTH domain
MSKSSKPSKEAPVYKGSEPFAMMIKELLDKSPLTGEKTTYKTLAEHLGVKQQSVSSWANGVTIPDTKHIVPIAKYFGVSCDYLLGLTRATAPDDFIQEVCGRYGLSETALTELSNMPTSDKPFGAENAQAMSRQAETTTYRDIINLFLGSEHGKKALKLLTLYYYADISNESIPAFVLPFDLPNGATWLDSATLADDLQREMLLTLASDELKNLRLERAGIDTTTPPKYGYIKPLSEDTVKKAQAAYEARNPHIKNED